ncbi:MAG: hypothetical protein LBC07_04195 [Elusimicrobiota bacterium]|jgi:hypothetical protein|nr:hypothetical protein [Elusimicrobiota bacterium]
MPKKIFLSLIISFLIILIYFNQSIPKEYVENAFNTQTVISAVNIGKTGNEIIFESADKKVEIENNAQWFRDADGSIGSVVLIKDVGSKWKQKTLQAKIIGDGEILVKLSGFYSNFSDSPVVFVEYKNLKINDQDFFSEVKTGRNDRDELIFNVPVDDGQDFEISIEYKNAVNFSAVLKENFSLFIVIVFLLLFICMYLFNTNLSARIVCKVWIWALIISCLYFIMLNGVLFRSSDDPWQFLALASSENAFHLLDNWARFVGDISGRFMPLYSTKFQVLAMVAPHGQTAMACYMLNALLFAVLILTLAKILDFTTKQRVAHSYIKLFLIISLPFIAHYLLLTFCLITFTEVEILVSLSIFLFAYKKIYMGQNNLGGDSHSPVERYYENGNWINIGNKKNIWVVIAIISAMIATYSKESVFIVFLVIACSNFLFSPKKMEKYLRVFNIALILNGAVFLVLYYFLSFSISARTYNGGFFSFFSLPFMSQALAFVNIPILILIIIFTLVRVYFVLFKRDRQYIFYDGLLFASFVHILANKILNLDLAYYFLPAIILFLPAAAHWLCILYDRKKYICLFLILLFILYSNIQAADKIKNDFTAYYLTGRVNTYNILKLNVLSKSGHPIVQYKLSDDQLSFAYERLSTFMISYIGSGYFAENILDVEPKVVEKLDILQELDNNGVYMSGINNLMDIDKRFENFVPFGKIILHWQSWRIYLFFYAHKYKLK